MLKPIQNVRQVPLKNSPKSLFQIALPLIFTNVIDRINTSDIEAAWKEGVTIVETLRIRADAQRNKYIKLPISLFCQEVAMWGS